MRWCPDVQCARPTRLCLAIGLPRCYDLDGVDFALVSVGMGEFRTVRSEVYEGHGIRFTYPADSQIEVDGDSERSTVDVRHSDGLAFALVRTDLSRPDPDLMVEAAMVALREDYPDLSESPANEFLAGNDALGSDVEFFSLDMVNTTSIRCFRTPRRTVFFMGQWSDLEGDDGAGFIESLLESLEELDDE